MVQMTWNWNSLLMPTYDYPLRLIQPSFDSPLTDAIVALEKLRGLVLKGNTPAPVFFQIKAIFHLLESLSSARIEGNHTTLAEIVDTRISHAAASTDQLHEIENIENAMRFLEESFHASSDISPALIRELHDLTVRNLIREGDSNPGSFRTINVRISGAQHQPCDPSLIAAHLSDLCQFINSQEARKYDLLKIALAHHRFAWIHPFANGNGRVVRLLTYAMLIKFGFGVSTDGRVLNPSAVFCNDRERYYQKLAAADHGNEEALADWCLYVLTGIQAEIGKVDRLTDHQFIREKILLPALRFCRERNALNTEDAIYVEEAIKLGSFKSSALMVVSPNLDARQQAYKFNKLQVAKLVVPVAKNKRQYTLGFANSVLLRGVIQSLRIEGFLGALDSLL
jgi:Fic family protein